MTGNSTASSPDGFQRAYAESSDIAFEKLRQADISTVCSRSGALQINPSNILLTFLGEEYTIDLERRSFIGDAGIPDVADQLIMLHYLASTSDYPTDSRQITFKEIPDGLIYYPTFYKRAITPLLKRFGDSLEEFDEAASRLVGTKIPKGDTAVYFQVLPKIGLTWVLWSGDSELPANGTVLFNSDISRYLPVEDIAVLCQSIAVKLCLSN